MFLNIYLFFSSLLFPPPSTTLARCVERRQRVVVSTAVQSAANVALLEEKVRERTQKLANSNKELEEANQRVTLASARQLQHFASMSHEIRVSI